MAGRVVVVGSVNMDLVVRVRRAPAPGETVSGTGFATHPGGKGGNQAVAAARAGAEAALVGRVGDDAFGRRLRRSLDADGVDSSRLRSVTDTATGVAVVWVDGGGHNAIVVVPGANGEVDPGDAEGAFAGAAICLLQCEIPVAAVVAAARAARAAGCAVFLDPAPPVALPESLWPLCDLVLPNEHEAAALTGVEVRDPSGAARAGEALRARGVGAALVKLGERGAVLVTREGTRTVAPFPIAAVDTTAAGDCFAGALAAARVAGQDLPAAARFASAAAALSVSRPGAQPSLPRREEIEQLLRSRGDA